MQAYTPENDPLMAQAKNLVKTAREVGVGSYQPILDQFPGLEADFAKKRADGYWDFIVAIACVFIAAARLQTLQLGPERESALMGQISADLAAWDPVNARPCFEDCKKTFGRNFEVLTERGLEPQFLTTVSIGLWVAGNILGRAAATEDEELFISRIGAAVTMGFFGWWTVTQPS